MAMKVNKEQMNQRIRVNPRSRRRKGFTLMEILLVAGILAVLAAFAIPNLINSANAAKVNLAKAQILKNGLIGKALETYKWDMGQYPDTQEGLAALYQPKEKTKDDPRYKGPYLDGPYEQLKDPWTNAYHYRCPGEINTDSYDMWSNGVDGKDDGGKAGSDDVTNWIVK